MKSDLNPVIDTERMRLIAVTPEILDAEERLRSTFFTELYAEVPSNWPPQSLIPLKAHLKKNILLYPEKKGLFLWYGILKKTPSDILILSCGFIEPANTQKEVELGYAVLEAWQGKGLACEAVEALVKWVFLNSDIKSIRARTAKGNLASARILEKCGFKNSDSDILKPAVDNYILSY